MKSEHKRVKHGQVPGDIQKKFKIQMREKDAPVRLSEEHTISAGNAKAYRKTLQDKGRTVQRQRDKRAIKAGLEEQ